MEYANYRAPRPLLLALAVSAVIAGPEYVAAQALEEVIATAQHREESVQELPQRDSMSSTPSAVTS